MSEPVTFRTSRRDFLKAGAAAVSVLTIGCRIGGDAAVGGAASASGGALLEPNAFVRIASDDTVTVIAKHLEMGQGVHTGLATLVAEELDADWAQVRVEAAPADASRYNNLLWGPAQGTGGSSSIANSWEQLRRAGATARTLLVQAAASRWSVPAAEVTVENGVVRHASGKSARFGELVEAAAALPVPDAKTVALKDPASFRYIGKAVPRKDSREKSRGEARFTLDVKLPGMLTAVVRHPPLFGATVKSFDATKAKAVKGVTDVVQIPNGVAVLATSFWAAKQGRDALEVQWDDAKAEKRSSAELFAAYRELAATPGTGARRDGKAAPALASAARTVDATYEFPFLSHAPLEPMNCVVRLEGGKCEIWNGDQIQTGDQANVAALLGIKPEGVTIHTLYAGGSFGRRANPAADYVVEAASIAKAIDGRAPVKMVWTREDDMTAGWYRPMFVHRVRAGLDAAGKPVAWEHRIVGQSILTGTMFESFAVKDGVDGVSVEGVATTPYALPNLEVELHTPKLAVPVLWWRSVGHTHTAYVMETLIDELAAEAGQDPVEFRRALLVKSPRHLGVLNLAAEKAGWGTPLPPGRGRGVAVHESFGSFVAEVAEVTVGKDGSVKVERVTCAVDCGVAVNPANVEAQMQGGIGFGLSAILQNEISLARGAVQQTNFHQYPPLRLNQMPAIEVHVVPSTEPPTGVGEPGVPPIGPAVANAIAAATGKRYRTLPLLRNGKLA